MNDNPKHIQTRTASNKRSSKVKSFLYHISYTLISIAMVGPLIWMIMLSFKTPQEYTNNMLGLPESLKSRKLH